MAGRSAEVDDNVDLRRQRQKAMGRAMATTRRGRLGFSERDCVWDREIYIVDFGHEGVWSGHIGFTGQTRTVLD